MKLQLGWILSLFLGSAIAHPNLYDPADFK